ncbi:hypothetical protein [Micromonospora sp. KC207]|uniref:hypothetical protein n=1 Tax=Micromonospora sp. KC207 TaxID=2530377 RepID=UPI001FB5F503|nr:hypothetical protein [Micromonospora sp. KC207]
MAAVARWLAEEYPAIEAKAQREKALILWLDQTGLRSDASVATGWAPVGKPPVVPKTGKRFGVNVMATISEPFQPRFAVAPVGWVRQRVDPG